MRDADNQQSAGLGGAHHIGKHLTRRLQVLEHLERADHVIAAGVCRKMRAQRLVAHLGNAAAGSEMRIEPRIVRMRNDAAEFRKATPDVEHVRPRRDAAGGELELAADAVARPELALDRSSVELGIERVVTFGHRIEEVQAGRRFPQPEPIYRTENSSARRRAVHTARGRPETAA